jgi:hypothetical protein
MQTNIRIIVIAAIAAGIGVLMIGSSLSTAAFAMGGMQQQQTTQSITQTNECALADCSNTGANVAVGGGGSTSQTINQENECFKADCSNFAVNVASQQQHHHMW